MKSGPVHRWKPLAAVVLLPCVFIAVVRGWCVREFDSVLIVCIWVCALHTHVLASSSELCSECICAYCSQTLVSNACPCRSFVQHCKCMFVCACVRAAVFVYVYVCFFHEPFSAFTSQCRIKQVSTLPLCNPDSAVCQSTFLSCLFITHVHEL